MNAPNETTFSPFQKLRAINVNEHTEKKNGLTYLSWAWAVDQLMLADPQANVEWHEPQVFADGTVMVWVSVTAFGKTIKWPLPVMDHRNKPIPNPSAFQINTALMRCLTKAISAHGLGLYIYAGEDLPEEDKPAKQEQAKPASSKSVAAATLDTMSEEEKQFLKEQAMEIVGLLPDELAAWTRYNEIKNSLDADEQVALWAFIDSKTRAMLKKGKDLELAGQA